MIEKKRLDVLLTEQGFEQSRERAKALIMAGVVYVNDQKADSAGQAYPLDVKIEVRGSTLKYVSRGGLKLEKALDYFGIDPAWKVRTDPRVVCMERCNIRYVTPDQIEDRLDLAVTDVSFISLRLVLPVMKSLLTPEGEAVALIKPQFEAGREKVGKKGVVREASTHIEVINTILDFSRSIGFGVKGLTFSPIRGPEGNIEFLLYLSQKEDNEVDPSAVVAEAHSQTIK